MPRATAALLASGRSLELTGHAIAIIAAIQLQHGKYFLAPLALWPVAIYYGYRVALDAELFRLLPDHTQEVDAALAKWLRASARMKERPILDRCQGATKLWRKLLITVILQLITLTAALVNG